MQNQSTIVNPDDYQEHFWKNNYRILVSREGIEYIVNADCEQDAIDELIDYLEVNAPGLLWSREEEQEQDFLEEYISGRSYLS